jgi:hypothetical protein
MNGFRGISDAHADNQRRADRAPTGIDNGASRERRWELCLRLDF